MDQSNRNLLSLGKIPPKGSILRHSLGQKIEKLCGLTEWQPRILYVTAEKLLIINPTNEDEIADQIPLVRFQFGRIHYITIILICCLQHEITSSDRTIGGPGEGLIWLINTEAGGYNNGRQVADSSL